MQLTATATARRVLEETDGASILINGPCDAVELGPESRCSLRTKTRKESREIRAPCQQSNTRGFQSPLCCGILHAETVHRRVPEASRVASRHFDDGTILLVSMSFTAMSIRTKARNGSKERPESPNDVRSTVVRLASRVCAGTEGEQYVPEARYLRDK